MGVGFVVIYLLLLVGNGWGCMYIIQKKYIFGYLSSNQSIATLPFQYELGGKKVHRKDEV